MREGSRAHGATRNRCPRCRRHGGGGGCHHGPAFQHVAQMAAIEETLERGGSSDRSFSDKYLRHRPCWSGRAKSEVRKGNK